MSHTIYLAAVFLPLLGFLSVAALNKRISDGKNQFLSCSLMVITLFCSVLCAYDILYSEAESITKIIHLAAWLESGSLSAAWTLRFDSLTAVMLIVVNGVSCLVHIYSVGYMSHDKSIPRFMAYLSLFTFFMLMLVTANNFLQLFFGWEGVGLASYLLIGFWFERESANAASMKAFLVNRVGDFGFALGIMAVFMVFGSIEFGPVFEKVAGEANLHITLWGYEFHALTITCLLLFVGAMGKSAQLGLHTWLPDAMEGPTPVSALIHAATMVTAGVFMVCRLSPLFEYAPTALHVVCFIGASTAFFAATIGLTQFDIKRVIAYSTCSQLGYMFFAAGVSAYGAAMFHLMTHAFFKALLFLGAGAVIHALHDEQDLRNMGGLRKKIPYTYVLMLIGSLALAGFPFLSGFYSKDIILEAAFAKDNSFGFYAYSLGVISAFLTAFYSWRLLIMAFHGTPRCDEETFNHAHEAPKIMLIPLIILAIGAVFAGGVMYEYFVGHEKEHFWHHAIFLLQGNDTIEKAHHVATWVKLLPTIVALSGIFFAYLFYQWMPSLPRMVSEMFKAIHQFFYKKWYFDELYHWLFIVPSQKIGMVLWRKGDVGIIDAYGPDGAARITQFGSLKLRRWQSGYLYHYAFIMVIAAIIIVSWLFIKQLDMVP